jgi:hypothetical protein
MSHSDQDDDSNPKLENDVSNWAQQNAALTSFLKTKEFILHERKPSLTHVSVAA